MKKRTRSSGVPLPASYFQAATSVVRRSDTSVRAQPFIRVIVFRMCHCVRKAASNSAGEVESVIGSFKVGYLGECSRWHILTLTKSSENLSKEFELYYLLHLHILFHVPWIYIPLFKMR